jgi:hypothetical protein
MEQLDFIESIAKLSNPNIKKLKAIVQIPSLSNEHVLSQTGQPCGHHEAVRYQEKIRQMCIHTNVGICFFLSSSNCGIQANTVQLFQRHVNQISGFSAQVGTKKSKAL